MSPVSKAIVLLVRVYRGVLSPMKLFVFGPGAGCRYTPSCSAYAMAAVTRHGAARGSLQAVRRVCRCHPWGGFGDDPVPPAVRH